MYNGQARYDLIREVKQSISIPVIANGDIDSPHKAREVLAQTGADAIMIAALRRGVPGCFAKSRIIWQQAKLPPPGLGAFVVPLSTQTLYDFYGEYSGCRIARKHVA